MQHLVRKEVKPHDFPTLSCFNTDTVLIHMCLGMYYLNSPVSLYIKQCWCSAHSEKGHKAMGKTTLWQYARKVLTAGH